MSRALVVALLLVASGTAAAQPSAANVLASVDQAYAGINTATMAFDQTVTSATFGGPGQTSRGWMWIERPGKLRWEYQQTRKRTTTTTKIFVTDGTTVTAIDKPNKQAVRGPLCANLTPAALSFLAGSGSLAASFTPTLGTVTQSSIELELTPIQASAQFTKLVLTVDPTSYQVTKSVITDRAGNTNQFEFSKVTTGAAIKAGVFQVSLKKLKAQNYAVTTQTGPCP
jgi:outer membrane lipoprotein-sorting protein